MAYSGSRPEETVGQTEHELRVERAACLARIGRALEARLAVLARLRDEADREVGELRPAWRARYERARREAEVYLWYLKVQRAANGLHDDRLVDRMYPIPRLRGPASG